MAALPSVLRMMCLLLVSASMPVKKKQSVVRAEVVNREVVSGYWVHFGNALGITRRELVEGAMQVEQVALGGDFATDAR